MITYSPAEGKLQSSTVQYRSGLGQGYSVVCGAHIEILPGQQTCNSVVVHHTLPVHYLYSGSMHTIFLTSCALHSWLENLCRVPNSALKCMQYNATIARCSTVHGDTVQGPISLQGGSSWPQSGLRKCTFTFITFLRRPKKSQGLFYQHSHWFIH